MNYGTMGTLLAHLKTNGPTAHRCGICTNLLEVADDYFTDAKTGARSVHDGEVMTKLHIVFTCVGLDGADPYPIQDPGGLESSEAYGKANRECSLWSTTEPYGQARWKVLSDAIAFCAAQPQDAEI